MEAAILTVHWHDGEQPVYSVHYQPNELGKPSERLATSGGDNNVRIWKIIRNEEGETKVEYLSTLAKHTQAVNVVRFDPKGQLLATAGDDGSVMIWSRTDSMVKEFGQEDDDAQESWAMNYVCRSSNSEIYDIAWSPDSKYIITGSTDNIARVYDASNGHQVHQIADHSHYVQGVAWDPLNQFLATQSADRSVNVYRLKTTKDRSLNLCLYQKSSRAEIPTRREEKSQLIPGSSPMSGTPNSPVAPHQQKSTMLYHSESLRSFFRRLCFSPDGSLLLTSSGIAKNFNTIDDARDDILNTVYIYSRKGLNKAPVAHLPGMNKPALVISFSPVFYELDKESSNAFQLPYKMVYAVATVDSVIIFDTQHQKALGSVSSIHYSTLTDLAWNNDGQSLIVSSADGFCTSLKFAEGEFGSPLLVPFKSLLPDLEEPQVLGPSSSKKRSPVKDINEVTKKNKLETTPTKPSKIPVTDIVVTKKDAPPMVLDLLKKKDPAVHIPLVKQKKRLSPTLLTTTTTTATK
jgi:chromatin assembly factor 1 subunit B